MERTEDPHLRHLFDGEHILNVYNAEIINLSVGAPGPDLLKLCAPNMRQATEHRLMEEEREGKYFLFQYGITAGLYECRQELSRFLSRRYMDSVDSEDLILTCGATHGLHLLLSAVVSPNGVIFVEDVTYMIALNVFRQFPLLRIVTVPMKDGVVDIDAMARIVAEEKKNEYYLDEEKIFWAMFYTIPTFHNPTGMTLPPESCKQLVTIARDYSILVVCDDVYNLLHYGDSPIPPQRLFHYDKPADPGYRGGNVVSNGSFSKILAPAVRLGWMECGLRVGNILRQSGILKSGGAVNHYVSGVVASLLSLGLEDKHLDLLISTYKERLGALCDTLDKYLPRCCSYRRPRGGYFVWISLPVGTNGDHFIQWCQERYNVTAIPGVRFSNTGKSENYLRLSIAFHQTDILREAARTLCTALLRYVRDQVGTTATVAGGAL